MRCQSRWDFRRFIPPLIENVFQSFSGNYQFNFNFYIPSSGHQRVSMKTVTFHIPFLDLQCLISAIPIIRQHVIFQFLTTVPFISLYSLSPSILFFPFYLFFFLPEGHPRYEHGRPASVNSFALQDGFRQASQYQFQAVQSTNSDVLSHHTGITADPYFSLGLLQTTVLRQ